ncbi:hypothetical protein FRC02_001688 [Tulasnella sp. 418]|nr:hypothetical protein FRC02_001688 [Tulasnella sp. 418]
MDNSLSSSKNHHMELRICLRRDTFLLAYLNTSAFLVYLIPFLWVVEESVELTRQYEAIPTETSSLAPLTPVSYARPWSAFMRRITWFDAFSLDLCHPQS